VENAKLGWDCEGHDRVWIFLVGKPLKTFNMGMV